jgi:lipid-A-disaccharide synthase
MKYYVIAGEASGDLHGSNLLKHLKKLDETAIIRCWGGDMMEKAGATLVKHFKDLAFMGFAEVIKNLPTILHNISFCKKDINVFKPDVLVLIDYPGFNLRIAKWAKQQGYKVVYYISPQVWAWKEGRVKAMKKFIDELICILPFEQDYYEKKWNWKVHYVGHPLIDVIEAFKQNHPVENQPKNIIALLPGSRKQEIATKLPIMLSVAGHFPDYQFIVAQAPGVEDAFYTPFLIPYTNVKTYKNKTYPLLSIATAALVTSGTATLETALFNVPEIVCYKGSNISYKIAKRVIRIKYISLVNLIMNKLIVKELIQHQLTTNNLIAELRLILENTNYRNAMLQEYKALYLKLSQQGNASLQAAKIVYQKAIS